MALGSTTKYRASGRDGGVAKVSVLDTCIAEHLGAENTDFRHSTFLQSWFTLTARNSVEFPKQQRSTIHQREWYGGERTVAANHTHTHHTRAYTTHTQGHTHHTCARTQYVHTQHTNTPHTGTHTCAHTPHACTPHACTHTTHTIYAHTTCT